VEGYGLSEASPVTHCNPVFGRRKMGSIGLPFPDMDARIVDIKTGEKEMPIGETGELVVKGPQVMKGYWNNPTKQPILSAMDGSTPATLPGWTRRLLFHRGPHQGHDQNRGRECLPEGG